MQDLMLDESVTDAIDLWLKHDLQPGSFTTRLLLGYGESDLIHYAHPMLRPYIQDHIIYVDLLIQTNLRAAAKIAALRERSGAG